MHPPIAFLDLPGAEPLPEAAALATDATMAAALTAAPTPAQIAQALDGLGAVKFGSFTLKSGATSPVYIDLRMLAGDPVLLGQVARAYGALLEGLSFDRLAAIPLAGLPIGTAVALATDRPMVYPRPTVKQHGTGQSVEGPFQAGETVVVIDDLISSGLSKREAIAPLEAAGLKVRDVVVLIDREGGGAADLAAAGYRLHAVLTLTQIVDHLHAAGRLDDAMRRTVLDFVAGAAAPN
jgi:uridine monophosphate synthetase